LLESARTTQITVESCLDAILEAAELMSNSFRNGGRVLKRLHHDFERPGLPAVSLATDTSFLTAYANDCNFEGVFERQVRTLGRPGDVLIAISTSGNSSSVIRAAEAATSMGIHVVALTGSGGNLEKTSTVTIMVPITETHYVQEAHLAVEHILRDLVEQNLYGNQRVGGS
jgi:D-sedoheptulose 7-phosphate isomerase